MCDGMSLEEMVQVREYLSRKINTSWRGYSPLRCSILLGEMAKVMGKERIGYVNREQDDVWARAMVAYQMTKEGYSSTEIGRQMMKDHSTIIHLRNKVRDVFILPQMYGDIIEIWDKFQKRIENETDKGTNQHTLQMGGEFPDCGQSTMGKESGQ